MSLDTRPRCRRLWPWVVGGALVGAPWLLLVPVLLALALVAVAVKGWPVLVAAWLLGSAMRLARHR